MPTSSVQIAVVTRSAWWTRHTGGVRSRFRPSVPAIEELLMSAVIVPDTNVLLGLYRLSPSSRDDALRALERVSERLWLPHQVGVEFYRNVDRVRQGLPAAYGEVRRSVEALRKAPGCFGEGRRYEDSRAAVQAVVATAIDGLLAALDRLVADDRAIIDPSDDDVLSRIEALFLDRVGAAPLPATIRERVEEFVNYRLPSLIPPGYEDAHTKPEPLRAAGDFLLWSEVLDHAEETGKPVLLITDDTKNDWYLREGGKTLGPRPELVREFGTRSRGGYHQVTLSRFVEVAKKLLGAEIADASVSEIEAVEQESARDAEEVSELLALRATAPAVDLVSKMLAASATPDISAISRIVAQGLAAANQSTAADPQVAAEDSTSEDESDSGDPDSAAHR